MSEVAKTKSGGGAATAGGTTFQEDVARYLSTLILAETSAEPPAGLPQGVCLSAIVAETPQPIDDLLLGTSAGGVLYVQAKTTLSRSEDEDSEFAKVIDQFVRQRLLGARPIGGKLRSLDLERDRFVLVVGHDAPTTITSSLSSVLAKCRPITDEERLADLPESLNAEEKKALAATRVHIRRSWESKKGSAPSVLDELSVLRLMHVMQVDLRPDGSASTRAKDILRQVVLAKPERAGDAWNALISICRSFGPKRTGGDFEYLRAELQARDIPLRSAPSYASDIESLVKYTTNRLAFLRRLSVMQLHDEEIKVTREVAGPLLAFAAAGHTAVVGEPGAGKSGCVHDLAETLLDQGADVVLLAADMVKASSPESLAADLGLTNSRNVVDVLQMWSGDGPGFFLVDALDAARSGMSLHVLCQILRDLRERAPRWRIVASVREYDLRASPDIQDLFAGKPNAAYNDRRFPSVRHIRIDRLSFAELSQVTAKHARIASALEASPNLTELIRNPFNLDLLCKLLDNNVTHADLSAVQTQVGLLDLYWRRRVESGDREGRLLVLAAAIEEMVMARTLHVQRLTLIKAVSSNTVPLPSLLSDNVLVELAPRPTADTIVSFSHNILFDYAVCRLLLDGLSDPVVAKLSEPANHDLLLAIRPSITMAFEELWFADPSRTLFWQRALAFVHHPDMRLVGKIIAAGVAAEQYRGLADAAFLLESLQRQDTTVVPILRFTIQAAATLQEPGPKQRPLLGTSAAPWMELAAALSEHLAHAAWEVRSLIWPMIRSSHNATGEQARAANKAAVALLHFGLSSSQHYGIVRPALEVAAATVASDPATTVAALGAVLQPDKLEIGAHEWLHPLAERLDLIAVAQPDFALQIVDVVFATSGDRSAAVPMGGRILALNMNKHDLVRMARHDVQEAFERIWSNDPITATRIAIRVMNAMTKEEYSELAEQKHVCRVAFRGASATIKPDGSSIWTAGDHKRHEEWFKILSTFQTGLKALAGVEGQEVLGQVLDVLRDEASLAVVWSAVLKAASEAPQTLGASISELLCAPEVLSLIDTRTAAGALIERGFDAFTTERRAAIEAAILRIPQVVKVELQEFGSSMRDRMLGCIPVELLQSDELKRIRTELDAAGGPPPNVPDFSISTSWGGGDENWWLRRLGVQPEKVANAPLLDLSKQLKLITGRQLSEPFPLEHALRYLPLLEEAQAAVNFARAGDADMPLIKQVEDEIIDACERLAAVDDLQRDGSVGVFLRTTLLRGADSPRPEYREEDDEQWDKDHAGWGSPSPRVDSALGLIRLAANSKMVDSGVLEAVSRLAKDPVPAVRFQVLAHCIWLYGTAPELMWSFIEQACIVEPRTAILTHFCANVILRMPPRDYPRLEPLVRKLYRRCRRRGVVKEVRRFCATFYTRAALWHDDTRAARLLSVYAASPLRCPTETNTVVDLCRELIRYAEGETPEESKRVRLWAFDFMTRVVKAVLGHAKALRNKHGETAFDQWPDSELNDLRELHRLAHNIATQLYIGSGAFDSRPSQKADSEGSASPTDAEKSLLLVEAKDLFDGLCDVEFVEAAYDVLQTLEFLIGVDRRGVILRIAALVRGAARDGIHYESLAADLIVRIVERYLSEYGSLFRDDAEARAALLDILDVFVGAGWPGATRLTYRLGEVFR